jgi:hypothetical protein
MTLLFDPKLELTVFTTGNQAITIKDLHMEFDVTATVDSKPNQAKIKVHNLSTSTRNLMSDKHQGIEFLAGYGDDVSIIFRGTTTNVLHQKVGTGWETVIYSGDGQKEFSENFFSQSYPAGTPVKRIIQDVSAAMGYSAGADVVLETDTLLKGASYSGRAKDVMDEVTKDFDYTWAVQWGSLEVLDSSGFLGNVATAVLLRADTGMLGSPTLIDRTDRNKKIVGVRVTSLLNPAIRPGRLIEIQAQSNATTLGSLNKSVAPKTDANGVYICKIVEYQGNNFGGEFIVNVEGDQRA